jgi:hypothetical protein
MRESKVVLDLNIQKLSSLRQLYVYGLVMIQIINGNFPLHSINWLVIIIIIIIIIELNYYYLFIHNCFKYNWTCQ